MLQFHVGAKQMVKSVNTAQLTRFHLKAQGLQISLLGNILNHSNSTLCNKYRSSSSTCMSFIYFITMEVRYSVSAWIRTNISPNRILGVYVIYTPHRCWPYMSFISIRSKMKYVIKHVKMNLSTVDRENNTIRSLYYKFTLKQQTYLSWSLKIHKKAKSRLCNYSLANSTPSILACKKFPAPFCDHPL